MLFRSFQYVGSTYTGADYISVRDCLFTANNWNNGSDYIRWYLGSNSVIINNTKGALLLDSNLNGPSQQKVYVIETGSTWTVPNDFNSANNKIHMYGGGGAGGAGRYTTSTNKNGGGGGGGGGYTQVSNVSLTIATTISYAIGAGGSGAANANGATGGKIGRAHV